MTPIDEKREKVLEEIKQTVATKGVWTATTCASGEVFGWDMPMHYALEQLRRRGIDGMVITSLVRHECTEWTVTAR